MEDGREDVALRDYVEGIREMVARSFDPRLESFHVRHPGTYFENRPVSSALGVPVSSAVKVGTTRTAILLGRNASGKTLFLDALRTWDREQAGFPTVTPVFRLPSADDLEDWSDTVASVRASDAFRWSCSFPTHDETEENIDWFMAGEFLEATCGIQLLREITEAVSLRGPRDGSDFVLGELKGATLLQHLDFSDNSLRTWHDGESDARTPHAPRYPFRNRAIGYLRGILESVPLSLSTVVHEGDVAPISYLAGFEEWLEPHRASMIGPALEEFFVDVSHVEFFGREHVVFLAPDRADGAVARLLESMDSLKAALGEHASPYLSWVESGDGESIRESVDRPTVDFVDEYHNWFVDTFPYALLRRVAGTNFVASAPVKISLGRTLSPLRVIDMTMQPTDTDDINRCTELLRGFLRTTASTGPSGSASITIDNISELDAISRMTSEFAATLGLRIGRLLAALSTVNPHDHPERGSLLTAPDYGDGDVELSNELTEMLVADQDLVAGFPTPEVHFLDETTRLWSPLCDASNGQRYAAVQLLSLTAIARQVHRERCPVFVLSDEFSARLHGAAVGPLVSAVAAIVEETPSLHAVLATHSIPVLAAEDAARVTQLFAERHLTTFTYQNGSELNLDTLSDLLGVDPLESIRLAELVVLVEGEHDEQILRDLVLPGIERGNERVVIINGHGLYGWPSLVSNVLRHGQFPFLLVHDKKNNELEKAWSEFAREVAEGRGLGEFRSSEFARAKSELSRRRNNKKSRSGDVETEKILEVIEHAVFGTDRSLATRMSIFGIDAPDIVDLLPIDHFFPVGNRPETWSKARNIHGNGKELKQAAGITGASISRSIATLADRPDLVHNEICRLRDRIVAQINRT